MTIRPETNFITRVSSNGIGVVVSSAETFLVPSTDTVSFSRACKHGLQFSSTRGLVLIHDGRSCWKSVLILLMLGLSTRADAYTERGAFSIMPLL